jgi:uracil-DNA glycosylase family 4
MQGFGNKNAKIMLVGECPGQEEDQKNQPFVGRSGKMVNDNLMSIGIKREDCFITNAVRCATSDNSTPEASVCKTCKQYLVDEIKEVKPEIIVAIGSKAMESVLGKKGITKFRNQVYWSDEYNAKVVVIYHPAYIMRNPGLMNEFVDGFAVLKRELSCTKPAEISKVPTKRVYCETKEQVDKLLVELSKVDKFAFDFETSSLDYFNAKIVCCSFSWKNGLGVVLPWDLLDEGLWFQLCDVFEGNALKIGHNVKFDIHMCIANHIHIKGPFMDTMLAHALIDENSKHGLDDLSLKYTDLGEYWSDLENWKTEYAKKNKISKESISYALIPKDILYPYAANDADSTFRLYDLFCQKLEDQKLTDFFNKYTIPTMELIVQLEHRGIKIDTDKLKELVDTYSKKVVELEYELHQDPMVIKFVNDKQMASNKALEDKFGRSTMLQGMFEGFSEYVAHKSSNDQFKMNFNSTVQLAELFYGKKYFNLPVVKYTDKGKPSLDGTVLAEFGTKHGILLASKIVKLRELNKFLSTYLQSSLDKATAHQGRIHASFWQHITVSGRTSCSDPNLQNIPRDAKDLKECFKPDEGMTFLKADLKQAEWRIFAHYSKDADMLRDIANGIDVHRQTAASVLSKKEGDVSKEERNIAKCFHPDTEILTKSGWKPILSLSPGEQIIQAIPSPGFTVDLEWVVPTEVFSKKHESGKLMHLRNEGIDIRVTPDHRMLGWGSPNGTLEPVRVVTPVNLKKLCGWANAGHLTSGDLVVDERLLRLAVATQAAGNYTGKYPIRFGFTRDRKIKRLTSLLNPGEYSISKNKQGVTSFYIKSWFARQIRALLNTNKTFPWSWLNLTPKLRDIVLEEAAFWDSCCRNNLNMYSDSSSIRQNIDVLQALASISNRKSVNICYQLTVQAADCNKTRVGNLSIKEIDYVDEVACISVPSTFILVRDGGIPLIVGQTINFGLMYGRGSKAIAEQMHIPLEQAEEFRGVFFLRYPVATRWLKSVVKQAKVYSAVRSLMGRIRHLPTLHSEEQSIVNEAERQATNSPIQAVASDLNNHLCIQTYKKAKLLGIKCYPCLMVHDCIIFQVQKDQVDVLKKLMGDVLLESVKEIGLLCKMEQDYETGDSLAVM